jgi:hypothetical protein
VPGFRAPAAITTPAAPSAKAPGIARRTGSTYWATRARWSTCSAPTAGTSGRSTPASAPVGGPTRPDLLPPGDRARPLRARQLGPARRAHPIQHRAQRRPRRPASPRDRVGRQHRFWFRQLKDLDAGAGRPADRQQPNAVAGDDQILHQLQAVYLMRDARDETGRDASVRTAPASDEAAVQPVCTQNSPGGGPRNRDYLSDVPVTLHR